MIDLKDFTMIPNVNLNSGRQLDPNLGMMTMRMSGPHTYTSLSASIRKAFTTGRFKIYVDAKYQTAILEAAKTDDMTAYRLNTKSGSAYCSSFIHAYQASGGFLPARFIGEWDQESSVFVLKRQDDGPAKKPKTAKKPRTQGLDDLLPKG